MAGIYQIKHIGSQSVYIGQSKNPKKRLSQHRTDLRGNYHGNQKLQNFYNKYGEKSFEFSVIHTCQEEFLDFWEQWYIWKNRLYGSVFNFESGGHKNKTMSPETKNKISSFRKGKPGHKHTEQHKQYMSSLLKGRKITWADKISVSKKGKRNPKSPQAIENLSLKIKESWSSLSKSERAKRTEAMRKASYSPENRKTAAVTLQETWRQRKELAEKLGISSTRVTKDMLRRKFS